MTGQIVTMSALMLAALVLFLLEVLTPTFGVLAIMGAAAVVGAIWQAFLISPMLGWALGIGSLVAVPVYLYLLVKYLPKSSLGRHLFLRSDTTLESGTGTPEKSTLVELVGKTGVADTALRPSGMIRVEGRRVPAAAEHALIDRGQQVRIIRASGMNVIVRPADKSAPAETTDANTDRAVDAHDLDERDRTEG
jgi:membrane-bound serine protease (ClpP class)